MVADLEEGAGVTRACELALIIGVAHLRAIPSQSVAVGGSH